MSNPIPLELQSKIASWRLRAAEGTLTLEEMKEGVVFLRAGRLGAASAAAAAKRVPGKRSAAPSQDAMLDELDDL
jgi:hypothetical protein